MANVKTTLTVEGQGSNNSFSNIKSYTEEKITTYQLDQGVASEFYEMHTFSPSAKSANSTGAPKAFCIYNNGTTGAEIQFKTTSWTAGAPDTVASETAYQTFLLSAGEMLFSNNLRSLQYTTADSAALGTHSALALASDKVVTALASGSAKGGDTICNVDGEVAAVGTALTVQDGAEKLRAGDYIFMDLGTDDVFRIVSVDSGTTLTIERDVLGFAKQILTDTTDLNMFAGSHLHDKNTEDDSGTNIRTDNRGRFRGQLLGDSGALPRGTAATAVAGGIVAGSVAIQFPEHGGYTNLGVSISAKDSTGLVVSTEYKFNVLTSLVTTVNIAFTTDSSDVSWGKVISLINQSFLDSNYDYKVEIVNGDVRFSHKKWVSGDYLSLADPTSGTEPWNVGNVPDTDAHETKVFTRFPTATITDIGSGKKIKNTKNMLIDDGNGNLIGDVGSGTIDYDSGIVDFTALYRAEFKTAFNYGSAHSGIPTRASTLSNMVGSISGRSTNTQKDTELTLVIYS